MSHKINIKKADGSFLVLDINTSINSVFRPSDNKSLKDILTDEYAPKNNPVFTGSISLGRKEGTTVGTNSFAVGDSVEASGDNSYAEGGGTTASGGYSHAEGGGTTASGTSSHAEGAETTASGNYSHAEGWSTTASGTSSHAEGDNTIASGDQSHVEGYYTKASSRYQHVQGTYNIEDTVSKYAHIVGNGTSDTARSNAHTLDWKGNAWYAGQVEGTNLPYTVSSKVLATVPASNVKIDELITVNNVSINKDRRYYIEFLGSKKLCSLLVSEEKGNCIICNIGNYTIQASNASTDISVFINKINTDDTTTDTFTDLIIYEEEVKYLDSKYLETDLVLQNSISLGRIGDIGMGSSAIGMGVKASGDGSHAEGAHTTASGEFSHAEGAGTTASGDSSHAEGDNTTASGDSSHAEGDNTIASGMISHAEGEYTKASGGSSHAEGGYTKASGNYGSHAEGYYTEASGETSHAEGYNTKASSENQHVQGKYNIEDTANKYAHIVGNGKKDSSTNFEEVRSNAHTLDWEGNAWYAGKLTLGKDPDSDMDVTTKNYVDTKVASIVDSAPETLDTLKELSNALGDDANFATTVTTNIGKKVDKPAVEGTEGQVLSKSADGSNVWVDLSIEENNLNTMLTNVFGFVSEN